MNISDDPMPGVAQPGAKYFWLITRVMEGDISKLVLLAPGWDADVDDKHLVRSLKQAQAEARAMAAEHGEVIVIEGTIKYRAWDRDKYAAVTAPELAMG